jgi:hypothetical protein
MSHGNLVALRRIGRAAATLIVLGVASMFLGFVFLVAYPLAGLGSDVPLVLRFWWAFEVGGLGAIVVGALVAWRTVAASTRPD